MLTRFIKRQLVIFGILTVVALLVLGVYRTSGIIVAGSRPYDCSSARNAPENPVPVSHALSTADSVVSTSSDEFMKSPRISFGAVSRSNGAVKTNFNAPSKYGEALPSSRNGHCSDSRS